MLNVRSRFTVLPDWVISLLATHIFGTVQVRQAGFALVAGEAMRLALVS